MSKGHILVVADTTEAADHLAKELLPQAGFTASIAEDFSPPAACDVLLVDVTNLRLNPFAGLRAQRHLGNNAPAILYAPRLTGDMSAEVFPLSIRDFIHKPADEAALLARLDDFMQKVKQEQDQAEVASRLAQTQAALTRRLDEMNALSRIGRAITSLSEVDTVLTRIVEAAIYLTHADEGLLYLPDESGALQLRAQWGLGPEQLEAIRQPSPDSDVAVVLASGQPLVREGGAEPSQVTASYAVHAALDVPIIAWRRVIGVLAVHTHNERGFEAADQAALTSLADYAAIALDKARQVDEAESQVEAALAAARLVKLHAETFFSPIDGIDSQVDTLLAGGFGPLTEAQHTAVARIKLAANRLTEIIGFIQEVLADFEGEAAEGT